MDVAEVSEENDSEWWVYLLLGFETAVFIATIITILYFLR